MKTKEDKFIKALEGWLDKRRYKRQVYFNSHQNDLDVQLRMAELVAVLDKVHDLKMRFHIE